MKQIKIKQTKGTKMKHNVRDNKGRFCKKSDEKVTRGYKGFGKGLVCLKKQYKVGETYEEKGKNICEEGMMHFCERPLDVLSFYPVIDSFTGESNKYAEVEAIGRVVKEGNKSATNKLRIVKEISLKQLIKAAATSDKKFQAETARNYSNAAITRDHSYAMTTGYASKAATAGYESNAVTTGDYSGATTAGYNSHAATLGKHSNAATIGNTSNAITARSNSHAATTGDNSHAATSGKLSIATTAGYNSRAIATGKLSIAAALGACSKAKATLGSWIVLAEYDFRDEPICIKAAKVDGTTIKPNTFYKLEKGEFVEA